MQNQLPKIAGALFTVSIVSVSLGKYFDSRCEVGCLFAAGKEIAGKKGNSLSLTFDEGDFDIDSDGPQIVGPLEVKLPAVSGLTSLVYKGVASEVKIAKAAKLAVRAYEYQTDKKWEITASENQLTLDFQDRGPDRIEIDIPEDFKGALTLTTVSGNLELREGVALTDLKIQSTSGDVQIESYPASKLSINTVSGDVATRKAGELVPKTVDLTAVSGDFNLEIGSGFSRFKANTVSGDMNVRLIGKNPSFEYRMHSISGDFKGIPGGVIREGIANKEMDGKVGEPKDTRLEFESISGDFHMAL